MLAKHKTSVKQPQMMVFLPHFGTNLTQCILWIDSRHPAANSVLRDGCAFRLTILFCQVGYTVVHVATALRLDLIEALLASLRWPHATEFCHTILDAVNAVKHQAMQMNIEISRRTETLDECNRTGLCLNPFQSGLFDQRSRDGTVNDLQYRCD